MTGTAVSATLGLAYSVYAQNLLGNRLAGEFVTALAFVSAGQLAFGPLNGAVARLVALYYGSDNPERIGALADRYRVRLLFLIGVLTIPLLGVSSWAASAFRFSDWKIPALAVVAVAASLLLSVERGILRGMMHFAYLSFNNVFESAVRLVGGIAFLHVYARPISGVAGYLAGALAAWVWARGLLSRPLSECRAVEAVESGDAGATEPSAGAADSHRLFLIPLLATMLVSAGFQNIDMIAAKFYLPAVAAGTYGASFTLGKLMSALVTPFTTLLLPALAALHGAGRETGRTFARVTGLFGIVSVLPLALLAIWPELVIDRLFDPSFSDGAEFVLFVAIARWLGFGCHFVALAGAASGKFYFLGAYMPLLGVQWVLLTFRHDSCYDIAFMTVLGHVVAFVIMACFLPGLLRSPSAKTGAA